MKKRKDAMQWWKELSSLSKTRLCDLNTETLFGVRRWETLTGREIEILYDDEFRNDVEIIVKNKGTQRSPFGIGS
jgi:hypothetical protein